MGLENAVDVDYMILWPLEGLSPTLEEVFPNERTSGLRKERDMTGNCR